MPLLHPRSAFMKQIFLSIQLTCLLFGFSFDCSNASSILDYEVKLGSKRTMQEVSVGNDLVVVKTVGGDPALDLYFDPQKRRLSIVDHHKKTFMPITEPQIEKLAGHIEDIAPLVNGLGDQIRHLDPAHKAKWERMIGGAPLDAFDTAKKELKHFSIKGTQKLHHVAGFECRAFNLKSDSMGTSSICIIGHAALGLPEGESQSIRHLITFMHSLLKNVHRVASNFGAVIASDAIEQLSGIPIEIKSNSPKTKVSMELSSIRLNQPSPDKTWPTEYKMVDFKLW